MSQNPIVSSLSEQLRHHTLKHSVLIFFSFSIPELKNNKLNWSVVFDVTDRQIIINNSITNKFNESAASCASSCIASIEVYYFCVCVFSGRIRNIATSSWVLLLKNWPYCANLAYVFVNNSCQCQRIHLVSNCREEQGKYFDKYRVCGKVRMTSLIIRLLR